MSAKIGFAILSHNQPKQLLGLVRTLNVMFGDPPIACHHDFDQCSLQEGLFPTNVQFVHPHIATKWGTITLPLAALKAFGPLTRHKQLDWFVLLSACDYPVRPAAEIIDGLANTEYDVYLDNREILYRAAPPGQTAQDGGFGRPSWIPLAYDRYCACHLLPWPRFYMKLLRSGAFPFKMNRMIIRNPNILRFIQFNRPSRIYGGDFWFQANRKTLGRLLDDPGMQGLVRYYRKRSNTAESLIHTALCNQPDLRICKDNKRYADWTKGGPHPKWIEVSDVPKIRASGAYFARKFRADGVTQDFIDRTVLGISP
jgi:hypothetical protein